MDARSRKRDTPQWVFQVWASFLLAVAMCAIGVWNLPGSGGTQSFLALGYVFCLFSVLALSKMIRDNLDTSIDTAGWRGTCWAGFAISVVMTGWGLWSMAVPDWHKGYLVVAWLFLMSTAFTLAKTLRDAQEADQLEPPDTSGGIES